MISLAQKVVVVSSVAVSASMVMGSPIPVEFDSVAFTSSVDGTVHSGSNSFNVIDDSDFFDTPTSAYTRSGGFIDDPDGFAELFLNSELNASASNGQIAWSTWSSASGTGLTGGSADAIGTMTIEFDLSTDGFFSRGGDFLELTALGGGASIQGDQVTAGRYSIFLTGFASYNNGQFSPSSAGSGWIEFTTERPAVIPLPSPSMIAGVGVFVVISSGRRRRTTRM